MLTLRGSLREMQYQSDTALWWQILTIPTGLGTAFVIWHCDAAADTAAMTMIIGHCQLDQIGGS